MRKTISVLNTLNIEGEILKIYNLSPYTHWQTADWQAELPPICWQTAQTYRNANQRLQYLASRLELQRFLGKKDFQNLLLGNTLPYQLSWSHCEQHFALLQAPKSCGIDLQVLLPKLQTLAPKFIPQGPELQAAQANLNLAALHWCLREAVFKAHRIGKLDFRQDIIPLKSLAQSLDNQGQIQVRTRLEKTYNIAWQFQENYCLTWALEL